MKKTNHYIALIVIFIMCSCQKETSQEDVTAVSSKKSDWLTASLDSKFASSQKEVTAYLFPTNEMTALVKTPDIEQVSFVLGYADNTIQIEVIGVDKSGKRLGIVKSTILKESNYDAQLTQLNELSLSKTSKRTALLNEHLLLPSDAIAGIEAWKEKLNKVSDLDEITSYEGSRFRSFSIESDVIEAMVNKSNKNIGLFLGLNPKGKVTTILIGLDENNAIKKASLTSKVVDDVYDATRPCPPNGDPEDPQ
ncbi:hypothetical protein IRZ71_24430 [Flavobacterium sp. ANB]|uniref:hypothetical protein n=1 Tax=unclassified Flavobacterium TaxID=196869 RepID=UPI0012B79960|nr:MULTISPECIES: hypothetical protein [unclassified Flavobacterium]MBF4519501.1 hypothetical protein [Flavobacterium sp. ANB]MTD72488.1 hypothetical protein [Flavobacterium sp. LC2016-13]